MCPKPHDRLSRREAREPSAAESAGKTWNAPIAGRDNNANALSRLTPELSRAAKRRRLE
jgi:hypothetical protein